MLPSLTEACKSSSLDYALPELVDSITPSSLFIAHCLYGCLQGDNPSYKTDEGAYQLLVEAACEAHPHGHG